MKPAPHIHLSSYLVKRAADPQINPRILAALVGGGGGALAGGGIQALRKMFQSKRDEEENGSPSILNGMLLGGLGGAGLGAGLQHMNMQGMGKDKLNALGKQTMQAGRAGAPSSLPTLRAAEAPAAPSIKVPETLQTNLPGVVDPKVQGMPPELTRSGLPREAPKEEAADLSIRGLRPNAFLGTVFQNQQKPDVMLSTLLGMNNGSLPPGIKPPSMQAQIHDKYEAAKNAIPQALDNLQGTANDETAVHELLKKQREAARQSIFR